MNTHNETTPKQHRSIQTMLSATSDRDPEAMVIALFPIDLSTTEGRVACETLVKALHTLTPSETC